MSSEGLRQYTPEQAPIPKPELRILPGGNEDLKKPHKKPHLEVVSWGHKVKESKPLDRDPKLDDHLWEARIQGVKDGTIEVSSAQTEEEKIEELRQKIRLSKENRAWDQQITKAHQVADYEDFKNEELDPLKIVYSTAEIGIGDLSERIRQITDSVPQKDRKRVFDTLNAYTENPKQLQAFLDYLDQRDGTTEKDENPTEETESAQDTKASDLMANFESFKASFKNTLARDRAMDQFTPNINNPTSSKKGFLSGITTGFKKLFNQE